MAKLIYSAIASLDEYIEDAHGGFGWAAPDDEVLAFVNEMERPIGTYLYGRRMYETMLYWETGGSEQSAGGQEFAEIWRTADKIVYSRTLDAVSTSKTRLEREFDIEAIRRLKQASESDITVGGADLAGQAIAAGLVDELNLILVPVIVGGGKPALPGKVRVQLELLDQRRFTGGAIHLRYRIGS